MSSMDVNYSSSEKIDSQNSNNVDSDCETSEPSEYYCKGGYHPVKIGDVYNEKYEIISKLGWGEFSTVWLAKIIDSKNKNKTNKNNNKSSRYYYVGCYYHHTTTTIISTG